MKQRILSPSKTHVGSPRKGYVTTAYINCKERFNNMNPRHRWAFFGIWLLWKLIAGCIVLYVAYEEFLPSPSGLRASSSASGKTRVLYIVTSLAEFNTGQRKTVKNQDRLKEVLLPVLADSIHSIVNDPHLQVDVFLITAFSLKPEREALIRNYLPPNVGLQVWDDACPLGYDPPLREATQSARLSENTRALARQHRYVIRDQMEYYDLFVAVEDDMRITGEHIQHFVETSRAIDTLRDAAPLSGSSSDWRAPLSRPQLDRMVPGFVRVEVLLNPAEHGSQTQLAPIPLDYDFSSVGEEAHFDPSICCHVNLTDDLIPQEAPIPSSPSRDDIVIWETTIEAMAVRKLPNLGWVALLPGPGKKMKETERIFGYWSGDGGAFGTDATKPSPGEPHLIAQQGGWLATRDQIHRLQDLCMGSFLPPFDPPEYRSDGQESMNVEFWSGGYQFFTGVKGGCNMQRIVSLKPEHFSKHFIYHAANNKQRQLSRERMLKADHFMAQLNSVRKAAEKLLQSNM